jgi:flagellar hook-basal body complex protein FliE
MVNANYSAAANAYKNALATAERILQQTSLPQASQASETTGASFLDMVGDSLKGSVALGYKSEDLSTKALSGKADLSDVVTAVANAETALNTVVTIRDKVINAYQDIIKMPI